MKHALLTVGASERGIKEVGKVLLDILRVEVSGDTAKVAACECLMKSAQVSNVTISHCVFGTGKDGKATKKKKR